MKLIVGLGNPGSQYEGTRHNIGFMALDVYASRAQARFKEGYKSQWAKFTTKDGDDVLIQKPMTFMNLSGEAVQQLSAYFKVAPADILVLQDELEFPYGAVRLKVGGGEGGHNGLKSMTACLGSNAYSRVRMGIGRPGHPGQDPSEKVVGHVLGPFSAAERKTLEDILARANQAIDAFIDGSFPRLMNTFNRKEDTHVS